MTMNKLFGFMIAVTLSSQAMAYGQDESPPFDIMVCEAGDISVYVGIYHYRQTHGAGPATIQVNGANLYGGWIWQAAEEGTRLTGYYHLHVKANSQNGSGPFYLRTIYNPYYNGKLSGGWLEMTGGSASVECKIIK